MPIYGQGQALTPGKRRTFHAWNIRFLRLIMTIMFALAKVRNDLAECDDSRGSRSTMGLAGSARPGPSAPSAADA